MRISDWSSDVCSSDLIKGAAGHVQDRRDAFDIAATGKIKRRIDLTFAGEANPPFRQFKGTARKTIGAAHQAYIARDTEIGRGPGNAKIAGPFRFQTHSRDIDLIVCADRDIEIPGNGHATPGLRIARYDFPHGRSFAANAG